MSYVSLMQNNIMAVVLSQCAAFHLMVKVVDNLGCACEIWYAY